MLYFQALQISSALLELLAKHFAVLGCVAGIQCADKKFNKYVEDKEGTFVGW